MKITYYILAIAFILTACNQSGSKNTRNHADTMTSKNLHDPLKTEKQEAVSKRQTFKNIKEIIQDEKSNAWVQIIDSDASLSLHFNLDITDTLCVLYSPECVLMFPFKTDEQKIIVYWDKLIDSKYDFDIVKAINKTDKKFIGKSFMVLELINDTTLKADYPMPDLIKKLNNASKKRTFFPNKFTVSQSSIFDEQRKALYKS